MDVATGQTILIIFLSVALLVFLILGIIVASLSIAILKNLKQVSQNAEETSNNIAALSSNLTEISKMVSTKVAPFAVSAGIAAAIRRFTKGK